MAAVVRSRDDGLACAGVFGCTGFARARDRAEFAVTLLSGGDECGAETASDTVSSLPISSNSKVIGEFVGAS